MLSKFGLKKKQRVVSNRRFKEILDARMRFADGLITVFMAENECGYPRIGISVGKRFGSAVTRNRLKRLLREVFRLSQHKIPQKYDYILMFNAKLIKKNVKERRKVKYDQLMRSFDRLMVKAAKIIENNQ